MVSAPSSRVSPNRLLEFAKRADLYFLSDAARNQSAKNLANTRMGLMICLAYGVSILVFTPWQSGVWPPNVTASFMVLGLTTVALPFVIRRRNAIRFLGHVVCAHFAIFILALLTMSAGRASGILIVFPLIPMLALLTQGGRAPLAWGAVALGLLAFGAGLALSNIEPIVAYNTPRASLLYSISMICTLEMVGITVLFDRFRTNTAIEVANRARAEMIEREERYSSLLEHGSEGILVVDERSRILFASPAAERLVGLEVGQGVGQRLRDFCEPEDIESSIPVWRHLRTTPDAIAHIRARTLAGLGPDGGGQARIVELTLCNRLENPAVGGIVIHLHDVTDLIRAEVNYKTLVEESLQGIAVVQDGHVVYANQALADLFGVSREDMLMPSDEDSLRFIHRDDRELLRRAFERSDDPAPLVEARHMWPDGSWRWIQMRYSDCVWEGRPARQAAYADITAHKELEARNEREHERLEARIRERTLELEISQKSLHEKERLATVGTLAAGIAHQINNPIGAILTSADFAILVEHEEDGDQIRSDALAEIRSQSIRCGKIVRSILQFSRAEPTEKWSNDLTGVLHIALDVTNRYARERDATVKLDLSREAGQQSILMNPIELEQVFVNLIRNAIESQPSGAHVMVTTRLTDQIVEITVADDGQGVSVSDESHIFEPFYTTRLHQGGSGLGLSVAHGIIEDHGGRMWLENKIDPDGTGARFHVTLPIEKFNPQI